MVQSKMDLKGTVDSNNLNLDIDFLAIADKVIELGQNGYSKNQIGEFMKNHIDDFMTIQTIEQPKNIVELDEITMGILDKVYQKYGYSYEKSIYNAVQFTTHMGEEWRV